VLSKASIGKTVQVAKRVNATWSMTTTAFIFDPTVAGLDPYHQPTVFDEVTLNGFSMTVVPVGPTPPFSSSLQPEVRWYRSPIDVHRIDRHGLPCHRGRPRRLSHGGSVRS
jgi:hypothetical protein